MTDLRCMARSASWTRRVVARRCPPVLAQHSDNYESGYNADADGVIITGQQGYYIPVPDSEDGLVFTYKGNTIGVADNPSGGGDNFVGSIGGDPADPDGVPFVRWQKNVPYAGEAFRISYDLYVTKIGDTITNQNVGSFSTQFMPQNTFTLIDLITWTDINNTDAGWSGSQVWFTETNVQVTVGDPCVRESRDQQVVSPIDDVRDRHQPDPRDLDHRPRQRHRRRRRSRRPLSTRRPRWRHGAHRLPVLRRLFDRNVHLRQHDRVGQPGDRGDRPGRLVLHPGERRVRGPGHAGRVRGPRRRLQRNRHRLRVDRVLPARTGRLDRACAVRPGRATPAT